MQTNDVSDRISAKELLRIEVLGSLEKYTRMIYKAQYNRSFIVNKHHKQIFEALEGVVDGRIKRLIINMPPRYSKTETAVKSFVSYGYALNPKCRFLHLSYSDTLVDDNGNAIKDAMSLPIYKELFPNSVLEKEKGSSTKWKTVKNGEFYAVSTQGQVTGFGAGAVDEAEQDIESKAKMLEDQFGKLLGKMLDDIGAVENIFNGALIIDDPLKPEDAMSDTIRERINTRFETTIRNRTNSRNTPIIVIMQRVHEHDLCGYLMEVEPEEWTVLSLPAIQVDERGEEYALWTHKHTLKELHKLRDIDPITFDTQYMQMPTPKEGLMYTMGFKTYTPEMLPRVRFKKLNYTDTADTGADKLCSINFIDTEEFAYVTDVLFTEKPMEHTEPALAEMLSRDNIELAKIEGNNGGRGFARNVTKIMRVQFKNRRTTVRTFTQTENKLVRIFSKSAEVQNTILMPEGWERRWPAFYKALMTYRKANNKKSKHDDAPDCITGVAEMRSSKNLNKKVKQKN